MKEKRNVQKMKERRHKRDENLECLVKKCGGKGTNFLPFLAPGGNFKKYLVKIRIPEKEVFE